ncbi:protein amalgam isoform X2 [Tribolium castaneum]|uniref:protein amalgam isoform X2 n=1 Tax=Tribolium castaneum TaxID=7070 RepID=UPI0030FEEDC1
MELKTVAFIFILLYTVHGKPTDSTQDSYDYLQNDNYEDENEQPAEYEEEEKDDVNEENNKPLVITTLGQEFTANLSATIVLPCTIVGKNFVRIWRKKRVTDQNSEKKGPILFQSGMTVAPSPNMKLLEDGSLEISNIHPQDEGVYECAAMDTANNSPKIYHKVTVTVQPTIDFLMTKNNRTSFKSGDTLELTCKAHGHPKPVISWHKGSKRFEIEGETLTINNIKHHDAGTYKCLADNKIGEPAFSHINIKVDFKPVITVERISVSSENNSETELQCLVHSEPKAAVVWIKDNGNIVSSPRVQIVSKDHEYNLVLKDLRDSDFGVYTCSATNYLGNTKKHIKLVKTPAIVRITKSRTEANEVVLTWEVQSKSNLSDHEFVYRKKGEQKWKRIYPEVAPMGDEHYSVKYTFEKNLDPGDYETKMRSANAYGWSEYSDVVDFQKVHNKHGHHKDQKKGHKHGKEPAEHQESEIKSGSVKDSSKSVTESSASSVTPTALMTSIALITFLQSLRI